MLDGYGNTIVIEHTINGEKVYTLYAHLNEPSTLKKGDRVSQGDCVGYVGVTGNTSGPHLHFEVIKDQPNPIGKGHATYDPRTFEFPDASGSRLGGASADSDRDSTGSNSHGTGAAGGPGAGGASVSKRITPLPPRDPLALDLDGDGIETTGSDGRVILFDHDADGVKTGTGWLKPDDGWLVLDRNGNGTIDSGRELFGTDTVKRNGQLATDGFDALRDVDSHQDGKIDAADRVFANLRIWRDLNQDGISQANELSTLDANHIVSIGVTATAGRVDLGNGNVQTAAGTFTRSNSTTGATEGTTGTAANLDLLADTFYRDFTQQVALTDQAKALPFTRLRAGAQSGRGDQSVQGFGRLGTEL